MGALRGYPGGDGIHPSVDDRWVVMFHHVCNVILALKDGFIVTVNVCDTTSCNMCHGACRVMLVDALQ